jgi:hypothetical protein
MIIPARVKSAMLGGVGWRQAPLSGYPVIDANNLVSRSGLYFQDAVSFVTIQNIADNYQDANVNDADFNTYLSELQKSSILEACQKVASEESDFIQSVNLYPYEKSFSKTLTPNNRFVGFEIERTKSVNLIGNISWIELSFDSDVTFNIYLYNSNKPNIPIKTQAVTTIANESVIVNLEDWHIADDDTFKGGNFYLGYFEADLGGAKAIAKDWELSQTQRSTRCHIIDVISLEHTGATIDITSNVSRSDTFGLNFGIDIYNDYTELFIRNKNMFYQVIQYQIAEKVFLMLKSSNRFNDIERSSSSSLDDMAFELYGNSELGIEGITGKLKRAVDNLKKSLFRRPKIRVSTLK